MSTKQNFLDKTPETTLIKAIQECLRHSNYTKLVNINRSLKELDRLLYTSDLKNLTLLEMMAVIQNAIAIEEESRQATKSKE